MQIPYNWTFNTTDVADGFDKHVREQLPWYDLATRAIELLARHYIPEGGLVYDIGAATGNMTCALADTVVRRNAKLIAVESSHEMVERWRYRMSRIEFQSVKNFEIVEADAMSYEFEGFDFAVCFLTMMFFPVAKRLDWLDKVLTRIRPGGAFVLFEKVTTPAGYVGTVLRKMAMQWKVDTGTTGDDIVKKELSLAGYQRPLDGDVLKCRAEVFFHFGEFVGWVVERRER